MIRAFPRKAAGDFQPLMQVACEAAFWEFNSELIRRLGSHCGLDLAEEDKSLFGTCLAAVKGITKCSDAEAADMLQVRQRASLEDSHPSSSHTAST